MKMAGKKKGGLGKGLDAIFAENDMEDANATVTLKISEIEPNRAQPRKDFNARRSRSWQIPSRSTACCSRFWCGRFWAAVTRLSPGERRWRAARMAGVSEVPVVIREMATTRSWSLP